MTAQHFLVGLLSLIAAQFKILWSKRSLKYPEARFNQLWPVAPMPGFMPLAK
jgi:hypothetical protein